MNQKKDLHFKLNIFFHNFIFCEILIYLFFNYEKHWILYGIYFNIIKYQETNRALNSVLNLVLILKKQSELEIHLQYPMGLFDLLGLNS